MAGTRKIAAILEAGIPVAGGRSIDCPEPVYGLAVVGTCRPDNIRRNVGAKIGDAIILTKPLGVGVYSAAFKKDMLSPENYAEMVATMTKLNRVGAAVASNVNVHAMTDVTGFGLLARSCARNGAGVWRNNDVGIRVAPVPSGCRESCSAGLRHWRVEPQLGELRRECCAATRLLRLATRLADGSADIRRTLGRLLAGPSRRTVQVDRRRRLSISARHRSNGRGSGGGPRRGLTRRTSVLFSVDAWPGSRWSSTIKSRPSAAQELRRPRQNAGGGSDPGGHHDIQRNSGIRDISVYLGAAAWRCWRSRLSRNGARAQQQG